MKICMQISSSVCFSFLLVIYKLWKGKPTYYKQYDIINTVVNLYRAAEVSKMA